MYRLVCLGWISKPERKENFSFETRVAPLRTQPKLQPRFLTLSPMRLSHNGYLELILTHNETRPITVGVRNPDCSQNCRFHVREILSFWVSTRQRQNDMNGARVRSSLQNPTLAEHEIFRTHVSARPLHEQIHCELMSAYDEALSVAMYVLLALLAVVENGYD